MLLRILSDSIKEMIDDFFEDSGWILFVMTISLMSFGLWCFPLFVLPSDQYPITNILYIICAVIVGLFWYWGWKTEEDMYIGLVCGSLGVGFLLFFLLIIYADNIKAIP